MTVGRDILRESYHRGTSQQVTAIRLIPAMFLVLLAMSAVRLKSSAPPTRGQPEGREMSRYEINAIKTVIESAYVGGVHILHR